MSDLTETFNGLLKEREGRPTRKTVDLDTVDEFLKEAYRIGGHIERLHAGLRNVRQAYLSTSAPGKLQVRVTGSHLRLNDRDRDEIDADAKLTLRNLNSSIRALDEAEQLRQSTKTALIQKQYGRGIGVLGSWASGGVTAQKSREQAEEEKSNRQLGLHREGVLWFLRQRLQAAARTQQSMMEARLTREMEKNSSILAKTRGGDLAMTRIADLNHVPSAVDLTNSDLAVGETVRRQHDDITEDQRQMFEQGNRDMLRHFEDTLDKVRTAEKSLIEISELQTMLVNNLSIQSAHIEQLVADSFITAENIGAGNRELKKATERTSPARYTFLAATGLCLFLIGWDLIV